MESRHPAPTDDRQESSGPSPALKWLWEGIAVAVIVLLLVDSYRYPPSSTLFVRVIGYPTLALCLLDVALTVRRQMKRDHVPQAREQKFWFAFGLAVGYSVLMFGIGFVGSTIVFVSCTPLLLGARRRLLPIYVAVALVMGIGFPMMLHGSGVILPHGWLWGVI